MLIQWHHSAGDERTKFPQTGPKREFSTAALSSMESGRSLIGSLSHAPGAHVSKIPSNHQQNGPVTGALDVNLVLQVLFSKLSVVLSSRGYYALSYRNAVVLGLCAIKAFSGHHETLEGWYFVLTAGTEPPRSFRGTGELRSNPVFQPIHY